MESGYSRVDVIRGATVVSTLGLIAVLLWILPQPGYSRSRLILFGLIAGAAIIGAFGVIVNHFGAIVIGIVGLFLLGFWQAVLSFFIWPVIGLLLVVAILDRVTPGDQTTT